MRPLQPDSGDRELLTRFRRFAVAPPLLGAFVWLALFAMLDQAAALTGRESLSGQLAEVVGLLKGAALTLLIASAVLAILVKLGRAVALAGTAVMHGIAIVAMFFLIYGASGDINRAGATGTPELLADPFFMAAAVVGLLLTGVVLIGSSIAYGRFVRGESALQALEVANRAASDAMPAGREGGTTRTRRMAAGVAANDSVTVRATGITRDAMIERLAPGVQQAFRPSEQTLIQVQDLRKYYGPIRAVDGISFTVDRGEIVGFLGPNGAGKSTTMKILTTYIRETAGRAFVGGYNVADNPLAVRASLGYLPEGNPLYREMRTSAYLRFIGEARHIPKARRLENLEWVRHACGLEPVWDMRIGELSKGYKQRVGLAQAIIHEPDILILDEPSTGLDPVQIVEIRELIRELGRDRTILLSTHILQEVTALCSRVMIIDRGELCANGTVDELCTAMSPTGVVVARLTGEEPAVRTLMHNFIEQDIAERVDLQPDVDRVGPQPAAGTEAGDSWRLLLTPMPAVDGQQLGADVWSACGAAPGVSAREVRLERPTLEDVFVTLTRREHPA